MKTEKEIERISSMLDKIVGGRTIGGLFRLSFDQPQKELCLDNCTIDCGEDGFGEKIGSKKGYLHPDPFTPTNP